MFIYRKMDPLLQKRICQHNRMFAQDVKVRQNIGANLSLACSEISGVMRMRTKLLKLSSDIINLYILFSKFCEYFKLCKFYGKNHTCLVTRLTNGRYRELQSLCTKHVRLVIVIGNTRELSRSSCLLSNTE